MACFCRGGFCELVLSNNGNDNSLSIISNNSAATLPNKKGPTSLSKREKRLQNSLERERIIGLLKWVLTTEEYAQLEATGNLVRLRANKSQGDTTITASISDNNHVRCGFWIDSESINLAKKEHRPNLARLAFAEFQSSVLSDHDCHSDGDGEPNNTILLPSSAGNEGDVAVCGICFNVYTLLKQARKLLLASQRQVAEDEIETTTNPDVGQEAGNNQLANTASSDPSLHGKDGASSYELSKPSRKGHVKPSRLDSVRNKEQTSSSEPGHGPASPQHISDVKNVQKSKRKAKQRKRDRDKLVKNSKTLILVAETDKATANLAKQILEKEGYMVDSVGNVADCLLALKNKTYSILLLNENLTGKDDEMIALRIRQVEALSKRQVQMRILVFVQNILSVNYHAYEEVEVDGFLPVPLEDTKLVSSIRKAVSQYSEAVIRAERKRISVAKSLSLLDASGDIMNHDRNQLNKPKPMETKHAKSAASTSVRGVTSKIKKKEPIALESRFQYDEKTSFPYAIIEHCSDEPTTQSSDDRQRPWRNLLVCHDVFDTYERFRIFFRPMVTRYPGMKILLWNYPGQAFTSFSDDDNLNNKYHAGCLSKLLDHVKGTEKGKLFMEEQFFILAHGSGAAIATFFAATQSYPNLSGIILVNGLSHVDSHFASVFHDCRNVFSCSPESRPDLPVYFYARFLFSQSYLNKTTSSLALNVYTAVHNPITLNGRKRLCQGVLNHIDTRPMLKDIASPIISIHGENATLVRAIHSNEFLTGRQNCSTIPQALKGRNGTALVRMKGGHELFQEKKYHISLLVEQILTGFQENTRVHQQPTLNLEAFQGWSNPSQDFPFSETKAEDDFVDKVVQDGRGNQTLVDRYQNEIMIDRESMLQKSQLRKTVLEKENEIKASEVKSKGDGYDNPEVKEVKEYMAWRIKRQKKRLALLERSAIVIQCALRSYMAKTLKHRLRKQRAATRIQCFIRVIFACDVRRRKQKELLAAMFVQRATRGYLARCTAFNKRLELRAQTDLARIVRGVAARRQYRIILKRREHSASKLQCTWRMHAAIALKKIHCARRIAATTVQKCYRGRLGRTQAALKREQFIFSRNQLGGIESGRQILSEHKLLALNLQSELYVLTQEKEKLEKKIEFHSTEIKNFERNITELESKMHLIFNGDLVCASEAAVREEKRKLNEEITDATAKILDRKDKLGVLQQSLEHLLRDRQDKLEQSKCLEARLAVLLDAQVAALEGALVKKANRVERLVFSHAIPTGPDQSSFVESNLLILPSVPPKMTSNTSRAAEVGNLQALHVTELPNSEADIENISNIQNQLVEHRLSPMALPSASKQTSQAPKKDAILPTQSVKLEARNPIFVGNVKNQKQNIGPKQPISIAHQHSPALSISNAQRIPSVDAGNHNYIGPSEKDKLQAAQLIDSTETMLKFGFMSMSLTYFSTLNMMRAMQKVAVSDALSTPAVDGEECPNAVANNALVHTRNLEKRSTLQVESWSINDVLNWLASISLSQYQSAFKEGAVDGAFLCELTDEDLRNTLGVEHRLHRKKILFSIRCLKNYSEVPPIHSPTNALSAIPSRLYTANENFGTQASTNPTLYNNNSTIDVANVGRYPNHESMSPEPLMKSPGKPISVRDMLTPSNADSVRYLSPVNTDSKSPSRPHSIRDMMLTPTKSDMSTIPKCNYEQLSAWVRHQKYDNIRDALDHMPDVHFDGRKHIRVQFIQDIGTAYTPQYELEPFHLNKVDEHGNTLVHIAAQTGNIKICKLLLRKGANPNHQNKLGQTPGHFAVAYQFFQFASWLFDEKGGGADDLLTNMHGLGPYDGLQQ